MIRWAALLIILCLLTSFQANANDQTPAPSPTPQATVNYTVHYGDTLSSIALRYHTTMSAIMSLNHITNPQVVRLGQILHIPVTETGTPTAQPTTPVPSTPVAPATSEPLSSSAQSVTVTTLEATSGAATTEVPAVTQQPVSPNFDYGVEAFFEGQDVNAVAKQITDLGMRWTKVRVEWRDMELSKGVIDYTKLDPIIDALTASKLNILLTVTDAPDWARSSRLENGPPDDFNDYATFIGALAGHYAERVRAYEIWNEPNLRRNWNSTTHAIGADSYSGLLHVAYTAVKAADPSAAVISAGLAPTGFDDRINAEDDRKFLSDLYSLGLASMSDGVGAHPFGFANPPDATCCAAPTGVTTHYGHPSFYFLDTLNDYHKIMIANGAGNMKIWVTQFGWGSSADTSAPPSSSIYFSYTSLAQQADYIPRAFELGANSGFVGVMILYNLNACSIAPVNAEACYYSLIAPSGQPRPAYTRLSTVFATAEPH